MISLEFNKVDTTTPEGKMVIAAVAILTSLDKQDLEEAKYGGWSHPHDVFNRVMDLANQIYHEEEYKQFKIVEGRNDKINSVLND